MFTLFRKEFTSFFYSATGYVVLGLFWLAVSLLMWLIPGSYNVLDSGYAQFDSLFGLTPWLFMFLCPGITMRMLAEEKQNRTWDWLRTLPMYPSQIVLGKYMAAVMLSLIALLPYLVYYWGVSRLADPVGNVDGGAFMGSMTGLFFLIVADTAIGLFASSVTRSQLTSFLLALVMCFLLFYGFDLAGGLLSSGPAVESVRHLGFNAHYTAVSRGVIDSRDLAYFVFVGSLFVALTIWRCRRRE